MFLRLSFKWYFLVSLFSFTYAQQDQSDNEVILSLEDIVVIVLELFIAGTLSTSQALLYSLFAMAKFPHIQGRSSSVNSEGNGTPLGTAINCIRNRTQRTLEKYQSFLEYFFLFHEILHWSEVHMGWCPPPLFL